MSPMRNEKGLTLVEIIIAAFLVGVVALGIGSLMSTFSSQMVQTAGTMTGQADANFAMEHMKRYLAQATSFVLVDVDGNGDFERIEFTRIPTVGAVEAECAYEWITAGGSFVRYTEDTDANGTNDITETLTDRVNLLDFNDPTANEIEVELEVQPAASPRPSRMRTTVSPRGIP